MGIKFSILYEKRVIKEDVACLSQATKIRIRKAIEEKLMISPEMYGKPLRGSLKPYWSLRVGDYRIIYTIKKKVVTVFIIGHRSKVYKK